jgi:hypothetical protein
VTSFGARRGRNASSLLVYLGGSASVSPGVDPLDPWTRKIASEWIFPRRAHRVGALFSDTTGEQSHGERRPRWKARWLRRTGRATAVALVGSPVTDTEREVWHAWPLRSWRDRWRAALWRRVRIGGRDGYGPLASFEGVAYLSAGSGAKRQPARVACPSLRGCLPVSFARSEVLTRCRPQVGEHGSKMPPEISKSGGILLLVS